MLGEELVDDFAEELVGDQGGVLVVGDDDAADALGAAVGVESVVWGGNVSELLGLRNRDPPISLGFRSGRKGAALYSYLALQRLVVGRVECARRQSLRKGS